jgi:uncharacterized protein (TIGR02145 family)
MNLKYVILSLFIMFNINGCSTRTVKHAQTSDISQKIGTITSLVTEKIWMDRNLGAKDICKKIDDKACYGDYYQFGRNADGHEKKGSRATTQISKSVNPPHNYFILSSQKNNFEWVNLDIHGNDRTTNWRAICPKNFRLPTQEEWIAEKIKNPKDAFNKLKLPSAGSRSHEGKIIMEGLFGVYWSMKKENSYVLFMSHQFKPKALIFHDGTSDDKSHIVYVNSVSGHTLRCIKN